MESVSRLSWARRRESKMNGRLVVFGLLFLCLVPSVLAASISFISPSPANGTSETVNTVVTLNASLSAVVPLTSLIWNWNGTNTTIYDYTLVQAFNFDNVAAVGASTTNVVDISNGGTTFGSCI